MRALQDLRYYTDAPNVAESAYQGPLETLMFEKKTRERRKRVSLTDIGKVTFADER